MSVRPVSYTHLMSNRSFRFSSDLSSSGNTVLVSASSSRYEGDWSSILHSHSFTELFYVREGKGNFLIGEKAFPIKKDDLIIINPVSYTHLLVSSKGLAL